MACWAQPSTVPGPFWMSPAEHQSLEYSRLESCCQYRRLDAQLTVSNAPIGMVCADHVSIVKNYSVHFACQLYPVLLLWAPCASHHRGNYRLRPTSLHVSRMTQAIKEQQPFSTLACGR